MPASAEDISPIERDYNKHTVMYSITSCCGGYGVCVRSTLDGDSVSAYDISDDVSTVCRIRDLLADNLVFPANVLEIIDDLLA